VSSNKDSSSADVNILVKPEDATIQYTGESIAEIGKQLALRATVWDSAANGYGGLNPESTPTATLGNITKIWIAFDIYPTDSCLSGTPMATQYAQVADDGVSGDGIGNRPAVLSPQEPKARSARL